MPTATKKEQKNTWIETVGRRKSAVARVRITPAQRTKVEVNSKDLSSYFPTQALQTVALEPFLKVTLPTQFAVSVRVTGGGIAGQAVAIRHGISRALNEYDAALRSPLKKEGFLKRDPRAKERRKPGLLKARKRKQWSKR